jgi:threonine dehydratase
VVGGATYADALAAAKQRVAETDAIEVHAYDQRDVVAGQGTLALELREQAEFDTVLVAVGGGGLIGGVTAGLDGAAKIVAVEPANLPTLHNALAAGGPIDIDVSSKAVAADSLGARRAGEYAYATVSAAGIESVLVSDDAIVEARRQLWDTYRVVVEHSGAAAYAALLSGVYQPGATERVAVILCGANTDPSDLA